VAEFIGIEVQLAMPALLLARYPALDIKLVLSNQPADLLHQEIDIALQMMRPSQGVLHAALRAHAIGVLASSA